MSCHVLNAELKFKPNSCDEKLTVTVDMVAGLDVSYQ